MIESSPRELATRIVCDGNQDEAIDGCAQFIEQCDKLALENVALVCEKERLEPYEKWAADAHGTLCEFLILINNGAWLPSGL